MSKRAEEEAVEYQIKTHGPNVIGGASMLSEEEYMRFNMNLDFKNGYEQAEKDLGWISVKDRLPEERKYESDTLQGHHEWTESDRVFVLDDRGVAMVDSLRNGKFWLDGKKDCDGFPHYIEYWMPIPKLPNKDEK